MSQLALVGGSPVIPQPQRVEWPVVTEEDRTAVLRVLQHGKFTSMSSREEEVRGLEQEWAAFLGVRYCVGVSNGTAALALALAALEIGPGDEVLVPALSFIASALAPLHQMAIPVFVDIDPITFNLDPQQIEQHISPRTRAILVVHLHGLPANMDEIVALARRHHLFVIEDAAQAHGATYHSRLTGTLGDIAVFSFNVSKNLPTCGEGGIVVTNEQEAYRRAVMLRQFGELVEDGKERSYIAHLLGWNQKMNAIQAAFTRSQLARFPDYEQRRQQNIPRFLASLADLPGLTPPVQPADRTHAWHILRLRCDPQAAGFDGIAPEIFRKTVQRALKAEGVAVSDYQKIALPDQEVFQRQEGFGRGYPWQLPGLPRYEYTGADFPQTQAVLRDSLTIQRVHLHPESATLLALYTEAFCKVFEQIGTIAQIARARQRAS